MYEDLESIFPLRYNITYYGADYPVDSLIRRMKDGEISVPRFQRGYIWNHQQASKFIESILLGLPIPNIFLAKDNKRGNLIIIDGQQRLKSLLYFYDGSFPDGKEFKLKHLYNQYENMSFVDLSQEDKFYFMNYTIHAMIISEPENSNRVFHLFERLNTSGTPLTNQEIRNAIYYGPFIELLNELSQSLEWKKLYKQKDERMYDQELILRFFAFHYHLEEYNGRLQEFLNHFMYLNRDLTKHSESELKRLFFDSIHIVIEELGESAFIQNKRTNIFLLESILVTTSRKILKSNRKNILNKFKDKFIKNIEFHELTKSHTTSKRNVFERFNLCFRFVEELIR